MLRIVFLAAVGVALSACTTHGVDGGHVRFDGYASPRVIPRCIYPQDSLRPVNRPCVGFNGAVIERPRRQPQVSPAVGRPERRDDPELQNAFPRSEPWTQPPSVQENWRREFNCDLQNIIVCVE